MHYLSTCSNLVSFVTDSITCNFHYCLVCGHWTYIYEDCGSHQLSHSMATLSIGSDYPPPSHLFEPCCCYSVGSVWLSLSLNVEASLSMCSNADITDFVWVSSSKYSRYIEFVLEPRHSPVAVPEHSCHSLANDGHSHSRSRAPAHIQTSKT